MKVIGFQSQTLIFLFLLHFLLLHFLLTCATVYYSGYHSNLILLPARLLAARQSFSRPIFRNVVLAARSLPTERRAANRVPEGARSHSNRLRLGHKQVLVYACRLLPLTINMPMCLMRSVSSNLKGMLASSLDLPRMQKSG